MAPPDPVHDATSLRNIVRERRIDVRGMDLPQRIATGVTVAGLVGSATLIWLRQVSAPQVSLGVSAGEQVTLAVPLFAATLALLCVGFAFLVSGALFARRAVAIVGMVGLTALIAWTTGILGIGGYSVVLPAWASWATRIILGAVWVVAALTLMMRRGRHGDAAQDSRLRIAVVVSVTALFGGYFLILWAASPVLNGLTLFPQSVNLLMTDVALLATPMLLIAAVDFGEWGELGAQQLSRLGVLGHTVRSQRRVYLIPAVLASGALVYGVVLANGTPGQRLLAIAQSGVLLAIVLAILLAILKGRRAVGGAWPRTLGFAALFSICALVTWGGGASVAAFSGALAEPAQPPVTPAGDYTPTASVRSVTGVSGFTALIPVGWQLKPDPADDIDNISNVFPDKTVVDLVGASLDAGTTLTQFITAVSATPVGASTREGDWQKQPIETKSGDKGIIWMQTAPGPEEAFYGAAKGASSDSALTTLQAIVRSFRSPTQTPATLATMVAANGTASRSNAASDRRADIVHALEAAFSVLTALVALFALLLFGRRWPSMWRLAILVYAGIASVTLVASAASVGRVLFGAATAWPVLTISGLVGAAGIAGIIVIAIAARSRSGWAERLPRAVTGILGVVIMLAVVHQLYGLALAAEEIPQWAAILILAAAAWDITMSGDTMTNLSSLSFPRSTRVVAFYGYTLILAAALVYYSGELSAATGRAVSETFFDPDSTTQSALFRIGFPVLLLLFLLRVVARGAAPTRPHEASVPQVESATSPLGKLPEK